MWVKTNTGWRYVDEYFEWEMDFAVKLMAGGLPKYPWIAEVSMDRQPGWIWN